MQRGVAAFSPMPSRDSGAPRISVLLPAYNEAENLESVVDELVGALDALGDPFEVVVVDDGSTDATPERVAELTGRHPKVRGLRIRRNVGKSTALAAGLTTVRGSVVVLMDADGQDDPAGIATLLAALDGGLDLVTGRRSTRRDRFMKRTTSRIYNTVTARVSGVAGRDFNSGFKAMTREVAGSLELYGELHRYIPVLAHWSGFRIGEVEVEHRPRLHGESKFGRARYWRGFLDLLTVRFLTSYANRPLHLFGSLGLVLSAIGFGVLAWLLVEQQVEGHGIGGRPALVAGVLLVIVGFQMFSLGLLAQLIVHMANRPDPALWIDESTGTTRV
jgi:glycosyltransferase involved in cell wall biosynthesis